MSLLGRSSRRFLARHPGQLFLTVAGVALGVAVVVAIDLAIQSAREAFRVSTETVAGRATHQVDGGPGGLPDSIFTAIRVGAGVRAAAPVVEGYALARAIPGRALRILGVDPFSEAPFRPYLAPGTVTGTGVTVSGAATDGAQAGSSRVRAASGFDATVLLTEPGAVFLSAGTAADAGVAPGDALTLTVGGRTRRVTVAGVLDPEGALGRQGLRDLVLTDVATAQTLLEMPGRLSRIDLLLPGARGEVLRSAVAARLPPGALLRETGTRTAQMAGMLSAFDLNLTALSLLALVFGMFLIYNAMTFSVVRRRELFGRLRALGVTRGEVSRLVAGEAAATGLVGSALGLALGVALGRGLVLLVTQTINDLYFVVSVESVPLPVGVLAKGALMGVATTLLAALPAVREAVNAPPRASLTRSMVEDRLRTLVPRAAWAGTGLMAAGGALLLVPSRSVLLSFAGLFGLLLGMALTTPAATVLFVRGLRPALARTVGILGTLAARGVTAALS
ncbi:MAG: FtsX-like permease family protein, partial [Longimicrobiales bacterium]|nr:FtsX-like permease family protein [Longimicrobiales bacterium]